MVTIYELLEVEENASKDEIERAYSKLVFEFRQDPKFDEKINKENEMVLNKLKLAYEILTNDEKRKKYDEELAKKRAENLIASVSVSSENEESSVIKNEPKKIPEKENIENEETVTEKKDNRTIEKNYEAPKSENITRTTLENEAKINKNQIQNSNNTQDILTMKEKNEIRRAAKKEFNSNLKKAKKAEEEYNEAYRKAYNDYLRKIGYKVKEPWTLKRIKNLIFGILILIVICIIMWNIPPMKQILLDLYNNNFVVKAIIDLIKIIFETIIGIFK